MQEDREEGILAEIQLVASSASAHRARHDELARQFGLRQHFDSFVHSIEGEKEVLERGPEESISQVAVRWDFQEVGRHTICKEAGFWVVSCAWDAVPVGVPGTQYGRGRYPSERYRNQLFQRPAAIFAVWGLRTVCVLAYVSKSYEDLASDLRAEFVKAKDNLANLTSSSRDAVKRELATSFRNPRFIKNPIRGLWYPLPRQRSEVADYVNDPVPDFEIDDAQFLIYLDWLERSLHAESVEFVEAARAFGLNTGLLYNAQIVRMVRDGLTPNDGVLSRRGLETPETTDERDSVASLLKQAMSADEGIRRHEDDIEEVRRAEDTAAEQEGLLEEEEEAAASLEGEEGQRGASHDECHYDQYRDEWLTEDGEPCPHVPDG